MVVVLLFWICSDEAVVVVIVIVVVVDDFLAVAGVTVTDSDCGSPEVFDIGLMVSIVAVAGFAADAWTSVGLGLVVFGFLWSGNPASSSSLF